MLRFIWGSANDSPLHHPTQRHMGAVATVAGGFSTAPSAQEPPFCRGCHSRLPRRRPPLPVCRPRSHPTLTARRRPDRLVCRPPLPVRCPRTQPALTLRRRPDRLVCRLSLPARRPCIHPALTPRRRPDGLVCRPSLPVLCPRTHPALTPRRCPGRLVCRPPLPVRRPRTHPALTPRHRRDRLVCSPPLHHRRPRTHPAPTPRRRPDRLICRPPQPVRRPRTHPALAPLTPSRLPLQVHRLQQPPGRHDRCNRHHRRPRTHPALTPRRRPDRLVCRPLLPVRRLRTRPALAHRLRHVRRCRSGLPLSSRTPARRHRHRHHRRRHRPRGRTGEDSRRRSPQDILRHSPPRQRGCRAQDATRACREGPGWRAVSFQTCRKKPSLRRCRRRCRLTMGYVSYLMRDLMRGRMCCCRCWPTGGP